MGFPKIQPRRGDIYFTDLPDRGPYILKGVRPCVVIQNNFGNFSSPKVLLIAGTSEAKTNLKMPTHCDIPGGIAGLLITTTFSAEEIHQVRIDELGDYAGTIINTPYEEALNNIISIEFGLKIPEYLKNPPHEFATKSISPKINFPPAAVNPVDKNKVEEAKISAPDVKKLLERANESKDWKTVLASQLSAQTDAVKDEYTGLVFTVCPECGNTYNTFLKEPTKELHCKCGGEIPLKNLTPVSGNCECGNHVYGYTNHTEKGFDIPCHRCGTSLIPVVYNEHIKKYISPEFPVRRTINPKK